MADITIESFQQKLDVLVSANAHARNKGDEFKSWCSENFGCDARISHVKEQRQITNRVSEQFRYFAPIVVFVCVPDVKRDKLIEYIMARVYNKLENVAIVGVNSNTGAGRSYTFEKVLTFKRTQFTEWAEKFFAEVEEAELPTASISHDGVYFDIAIPEEGVLTIEQLGEILSNMYKVADNKTTAIHMFGLKYARIILEQGYAATQVVNASDLPESYHVEVNKGISMYKAIRDNTYGIGLANIVPGPIDANPCKVVGGYNKIYYGAPGCGKSFIVNKMLDDANVPDANRIRVTFHPEYANCDFVGQILPTIETKFDIVTGEEKEIVKYIFNPGPFTLALERARKTNDMVYLVIEEINRGNAAAIFGDLFQLLDREKDMDKPNWGESEYPICNVNIQKYLGMDEGKSTIIPSNLTILATMNTSDQSVFTLDTAFKRRWSFEQISNNIEKDTKHEYKGWYVPGTNVTLERFLTVINAEILKHKVTSEDKRMGKYFISKDCLTETPCDVQDAKMEAEMFAYKVLEYIWNDVCKIGKDEWFDTISITTLEDLIEAFVEPESDATPLSVFKSITF